MHRQHFLDITETAIYAGCFFGAVTLGPFVILVVKDLNPARKMNKGSKDT